MATCVTFQPRLSPNNTSNLNSHFFEHCDVKSKKIHTSINRVMTVDGIFYGDAKSMMGCGEYNACGRHALNSRCITFCNSYTTPRQDWIASTVDVQHFKIGSLLNTYLVCYLFRTPAHRLKALIGLYINCSVELVGYLQSKSV